MTLYVPLLLPSYIHQIISVIYDPSAIKPTFEMLVDNLGLILQKHAPLNSCGVPMNQNDPWYIAMKSDIIDAKKHRHWSESQYLRYPSILNKQQFNKAKNCMVKQMHKAMSKFIYLKLAQRLQKRVCLPHATNCQGLKN